MLEIRVPAMPLVSYYSSPSLQDSSMSLCLSAIYFVPISPSSFHALIRKP